MIRVQMTQEDFSSWRNHLRERAYRAAKLAAPDAEYVRGIGWSGPRWQEAQDAYCLAMMGRDRGDA